MINILIDLKSVNVNVVIDNINNIGQERTTFNRTLFNELITDMS